MLFTTIFTGERKLFEKIEWNSAFCHNATYFSMRLRDLASRSKSIDIKTHTKQKPVPFVLGRYDCAQSRTTMEGLLNLDSLRDSRKILRLKLSCLIHNNQTRVNAASRGRTTCERELIIAYMFVSTAQGPVFPVSFFFCEQKWGRRCGTNSHKSLYFP